MTEIIRANGQAGRFFFERDTMRFFRSRVCGSTLVCGPGGVYFVTSEQFQGSDGVRDARRFTVRKFDPADGDVTTAGQFQEHATQQGAAKAALLLAEGVAR